MTTRKVCKKCGIEKDIEEFSFRTDTQKYRNQCKECIAARGETRYHNKKEQILDQKKKYYQNNRDDIRKKQKEYYENNKNKIQAYRKKYYQENNIIIKIKATNYYQNNKEYIKQRKREYNKKNKDKRREKNREFRKNNKEKINKFHREYENKRLATDLFFKLSKNISRHVRRAIKSSNSSKAGKSTFDHLPYTKEELKIHLESLFEPWMNWSNHGVCRWDDNDPSTWTWQIDHIIPQSDLPYDSMDHPNFKLCWALSNLRPLSAKQNHQDGINRVRHKKSNH